jgi:hypothetical protein
LIVSLMALLVLPAQAQTVTDGTIGIGDTVEGALTANKLAQTYTLEAVGGQVVSITLRSDDFDAHLSLLDGEGNLLTRNDDTNGRNSAILSYALPPSSSYTIVAESYRNYSGGEGEVGAYTLAVTEQLTEPMEYGQLVNSELTPTETARNYVFAGQAGDVIVVSQSSTQFDAFLYLLDSSGTQLVSNDDGGGGSDALIGPFALPSTGNYTIHASSFGGTATGTFTLDLNRIEIVPITVNEDLEVEFGEGERGKYFSFDGTLGELVSITVSGDGVVNTVLSLNDPANAQIASDDDSGSGPNPEIFQQSLTLTGSYTVALQVINGRAGNVTIRVDRLPPPSLDSGAQTITFNEAQVLRAVTFTANAGETVRLNIRATSVVDLTKVESPELSITLLQGQATVATADATFITDLNFSFTTATSGLVVVQIEDSSGSGLAYEVSLERGVE